MMATEREIEAAAESLCKSVGGDWKYVKIAKDDGCSYRWHIKNAKAALEAAEKVREEK